MMRWLTWCLRDRCGFCHISTENREKKLAKLAGAEYPFSPCLIRGQITTQTSHVVVTELAATAIGPVNVIHPTLGCAVVEGS